MPTARKIAIAVAGFALIAGNIAARAQSVAVTIKLDTNRVDVGAVTTLHVFAQIVEAQRSGSDRIFSWYIDLLNSNPSSAILDVPNLKKPAADQDPATSSKGSVEGGNLRGIYDTFLDLNSAGRDTPVELLSIPIKAVAPGKTRLNAQAGTTVPALGADFIVATTGGGDPLLGGDYGAASVELEVPGANIDATISIASAPLPNNQGSRVTLTFPTVPGLIYTVETRNSFSAGIGWQVYPGGPHTSGTVILTNSLPQRFFRVRVE